MDMIISLPERSVWRGVLNSFVSGILINRIALGRLLICSYVDWGNGIMKREENSWQISASASCFLTYCYSAIDEIQADHTDQDACRFTGCQCLVVQEESDEQERDGEE